MPLKIIDRSGDKEFAELVDRFDELSQVLRDLSPAQKERDELRQQILDVIDGAELVLASGQRVLEVKTMKRKAFAVAANDHIIRMKVRTATRRDAALFSRQAAEKATA